MGRQRRRSSVRVFVQQRGTGWTVLGQVQDDGQGRCRVYQVKSQSRSRGGRSECVEFRLEEKRQHQNQYYDLMRKSPQPIVGWGLKHHRQSAAQTGLAYSPSDFDTCYPHLAVAALFSCPYQAYRMCAQYCWTPPLRIAFNSGRAKA